MRVGRASGTQAGREPGALRGVLIRLAAGSRRIWGRARRGASGGPRGIAYWQRRARRHGARAVLHLGHAEHELEALTRRQAEQILPALRARLRGDERLALDFGCGSGRFTEPLAQAIGGRALGVDPVPELLALAPATANAEFRLLRRGRIPLADAAADVVFVCLVLGGITDDAALRAVAAELARVLSPQGLLLLVENTTARADLPHWRYRTAASYAALFPCVELEPAGHYFDLGERVEILAGRCRARGGA
jgi:SAM-dependent methyltransferase